MPELSSGNRAGKGGLGEQERARARLCMLGGRERSLLKAEKDLLRGGWPGASQPFEVVTKSSRRPGMCWRSLSRPGVGETSRSIGCLVSRATFQGFEWCLLFCGLEGRKATVYIYHRAEQFANRKVSFFA